VGPQSWIDLREVAGSLDRPAPRVDRTDDRPHPPGKSLLTEGRNLENAFRPNPQEGRVTFWKIAPNHDGRRIRDHEGGLVLRISHLLARVDVAADDLASAASDEIIDVLAVRRCLRRSKGDRDPPFSASSAPMVDSSSMILRLEIASA
jgi:hypothetical protein